VIDKRGRFIHVNAAAHRIMPGAAELNRQRDPLREPAAEWGLFQLDGLTPLTPEGRPAVRALAGENQDNFRYVMRGRLSGGAEKVIQGHSRALLLPHGEPYGAVLVFSDNTAVPGGALRTASCGTALFVKHPMWGYDIGRFTSSPLTMQPWRRTAIRARFMATV
jgi:hypothetical protein